MLYSLFTQASFGSLKDRVPRELELFTNKRDKLLFGQRCTLSRFQFRSKPFVKKSINSD